MFALTQKEMASIEKKLQSPNYEGIKNSMPHSHAMGCPSCNGQCKSGCGVTCVSILS